MDNMRSYFLMLSAAFLTGWLVTLSLVVAGYLLALQVLEMLRNRRVDAERERLGLKRGRKRPAYPPFGPRFFPARPANSGGANYKTAPSQTWTIASTTAGYCEAAKCATRTSTLSETNDSRAQNCLYYTVAMSQGVPPRGPLARSTRASS